MEMGGEGGVERGEWTAVEGRMGREDVGRRRRVGLVVRETWEWHTTKTLARVNKCVRHHVMEMAEDGGVEKVEGTAGEGRM